MNQPEFANQELIAQVLTKLLQEQPSLFPKTCQCHWIDPHKLKMLLWKDKDTFILKIAEQKFVGVARQDRRDKVYWRFRELYEDNSPLETKPAAPKTALEHHWTPLAEEKPFEANQPLSPTSSSAVDRKAKFLARQAQVQPASPTLENTQAKDNYAHANPNKPSASS
jgi:hypothetical protein